MHPGLLVSALIPLVSAQFGFFEQMFQGHGSQQQQHRPGGASAWAAQSEAGKHPVCPTFSLTQWDCYLSFTLLLTSTVQCSRYLCPKTLDCVDAPVACPCPSPEDIKCSVPDAQDIGSATVFCVRGETECAEIERLAKR